MKKMHLAMIAFGASAILALGAVIAMANSHDAVKTVLVGYQEVPANSTTGNGSFEAELGHKSIDYRLAYGHLEGGTVLFAHIHLGRTATNGGVAVFLCGGGGKPTCPQSGVVEGTIVPADVVGPSGQGIEPGEFRELVRAIRRNATYINVHTEAFPGGEIRGNLIAS
ncbi:MAG TPA: CHRD domain-containing protein [Actinomycetota bacterium]